MGSISPTKKKKVVGYARVSTTMQDLKLQIDALRKAKCSIIYKEKISATSSKRPEFESCLVDLNKGDTLVVWKLDRLGRSLIDLFKIGEELKAKGVELKSITQNLDTKTSMGKFFFGMMALFAEYERDQIVERTKAGMAAAKEKGVHLGRPAMGKNSRELILFQAYVNQGLSRSKICDAMGICRSSYYNYLNRIKKSN